MARLSPHAVATLASRSGRLRFAAAPVSAGRASFACFRRVRGRTCGAGRRGPGPGCARLPGAGLPAWLGR
eukprot:9714582-Alexandrium_andersonii.AAC.1